MCCIVEIVMSIVGIFALIKGRVALTRSLVVVGAPAYAIGILLTLTFPLLFGIGLLFGVFEAARAHGQRLDPQRFMQEYWYLDLVAVPYSDSRQPPFDEA